VPAAGARLQRGRCRARRTRCLRGKERPARRGGAPARRPPRRLPRSTNTSSRCSSPSGSATSSTTRRSRRTRSDGLASATTLWTNATFGRRAVQAQDAVRHRAQTTGRDRRATRIAHSVGPLVQLCQGSLSPVHASFERLANPDVGQTTHRLRCAIADSLAEAHRATTLGTLRQHFQTLAVTVPARLELSAHGVKVEIIDGHHPYVSPKCGARPAFGRTMARIRERGLRAQSYGTARLSTTIGDHAMRYRPRR